VISLSAEGHVITLQPMRNVDIITDINIYLSDLHLYYDDSKSNQTTQSTQQSPDLPFYH